MRGSHTIGIVGASAALLGAASPQGVSAEVLYLNDLNSVSGNAVAYANGTAVASGDAATSYLTAKTRAEFSAFSAPDGTGGGVSVGVGFASGRVMGMASSATTLTGAPIVTSWRTGYSEAARTTTTTTTTITTEFEALQATVFDYEEMTSQFTSPSSATFAFEGKAETSLDEAVVTTIASTRTKTLVAKGDNHAGAPAPTVTTTTRSTRVKTMFAPPDDPNISISRHTQAEASSTNSSAYTFEVLGARGGGVAITYTTEATLDGTVAYQIDLIDDSTQTLLGMADAIGSNSRGTEAWTFASPGTYTLIVSGHSDVDASASDAYGVLGDASFDWSNAVFQMRVWTESDPTIPELSTWAMMLIGFAGLGYMGYRKARGAWSASVLN
jgi:hypothetical protein